MKSKQYNVKVFEVGIDNEESFVDFMDANYELIKNHLLSLHGNLTEKIKKYLKDNSLVYLYETTLPLPKRGVKEFFINATVTPPEDKVSEDKDNKNIPEELQEEEEDELRESPLKVLSNPVRSGQFIQHNGSVLTIDRVNSGAKIAAMGSVVALGKVEGDISSLGECLIVPPVTRGNIFFHGKKIDISELIHPLNKIIYIDDEMHIKSISKKELA